MESVSLKKRIIIFSLFITVFVLILALIFFRQTNKPLTPAFGPTPTIVNSLLPNLNAYPKPTIIPAQPAATGTNFPITFSLPSLYEFPSSVEITNTTHGLTDETIASFTKTFSFTSQPKVYENTLLYTKEGIQEALLINKASGFIQYTKSAPSLTQTRVFSQQAVGVANNLVRGLNIRSIIPTANTVRGYSTLDAEEGSETTDLESAAVYGISYMQNYKGLPIFYQLGTQANVTVWIDQYANLLKIEYFDLQLDSQRLVNIKPLSKVIEETQQGLATPVKVGVLSESLENIQSLNVTSVLLGYFDDKTNTILYPIYVLKGLGQFPDGEREVTLYLPAAY